MVILTKLIYTDGCVYTHCQLHAMQSQRLRSGVLVRRILVQVERKNGAEILKEPVTPLEFCGDRMLFDLGTVLGIHNPTVVDAEDKVNGDSFWAEPRDQRSTILNLRLTGVTNGSDICRNAVRQAHQVSDVGFDSFLFSYS